MRVKRGTTPDARTVITPPSVYACRKAKDRVAIEVQSKRARGEPSWPTLGLERVAGRSRGELYPAGAESPTYGSGIGRVNLGRIFEVRGLTAEAKLPSRMRERNSLRRDVAYQFGSVLLVTRDTVELSPVAGKDVPQSRTETRMSSQGLASLPRNGLRLDPGLVELRESHSSVAKTEKEIQIDDRCGVSSPVDLAL